MLRYILLPLTVFLLLVPCFAGQWYPGDLHSHTITYSDGGKDPAGLANTVQAELRKCRSDGKGFMIVTDHFDAIASRGLMSAYSVAIRDTSIADQFVAFAGLEHGTNWRPEVNTFATSHILAIGLLPSDFSQFITYYDRNDGTYTEKFDQQQEIIQQIIDFGMLPIAAHPSQLLIGGTTALRVDHRFNMKSGYSGLRGVEMFNVLGPGQEEESIQFYLRLVASGQPVFITSGCDYHGTVSSAIPELALDSLSRITWVYADDLTEEGIIKGIASGQTYAAQLGASFRNFRGIGGQNPGAKIIGVDTPIIQASAIAKADNVQMIIYRNGQEVARQDKASNPSRQAMYSLSRPGTGEIQSQYSGGGYLGWIDSDRQETVRSYIIRVMGIVGGIRRTLLITSPIYLKPRPIGLTGQFFDAIKSGDTARVSQFLATDPTLANERDLRPMRDTETACYHSSQPLALSIAIALGRTDIIKFLLNAGASPEDYLGVGEPGPMMVAAYYGSIQAAELLLEHGADINICTDGNTPLVWAIDGRHSDLAKWLIEHGADINHPGDSDLTPLALARKANLPEIVNLLRSRGAKEQP